MGKKRKAAVLISLSLAMIFAAIMALGFRAYLYRKFGYDSIIGGSLPNFVAVVLISLGFKAIKGEKPDAGPVKMSAMGTGAMIAYEFVQTFIQGRTFDWFDVLASVLGGVFVLIVLTLIERSIVHIYTHPREEHP